VDERVRQAGLLYEQAVLSGDAAVLAAADRELDAAEADLAVARGRVTHTRFLLGRDRDPAAAVEDPGELALFERALFERAGGLYRALGDTRGEAEALFWMGCFHQVVRRDDGTAVPLLERSLELATEAGDTVTMAEALRHLGIAAHRAGQLDEARGRLEEATELRGQAGQLPSAAANMIGLAYIAIAQDRADDARGLLDEADAIAAGSGAHRIRQQVTEARAAIGLTRGRVAGRTAEPRVRSTDWRLRVAAGASRPTWTSRA
jgi:tetratricopeptide (TPR) repeat protein